MVIFVKFSPTALTVDDVAHTNLAPVTPTIIQTVFGDIVAIMLGGEESHQGGVRHEPSCRQDRKKFHF